MLATIVDWAALGKVVVYSFAAALVLTIVFTTGVLSLEGRPGRQPSPAARLSAPPRSGYASSSSASAST